MNLVEYIYIIPACLIAIVLHELSHGFVSYLLGDPTPKNDGRLTLNPLKHLDIMGIVSLILFRVGWAKPVRINTMYYKKPRLGIFLVSFAGPLCNIILALISGLFVVIGYKYSLNILYNFFLYMVMINTGLAVFNLIPIPPLDGSNILSVFLPVSVREKYMSYSRYGTFILIGLIVLLNLISNLGFPNLLTDLITNIMNFFVNIWSFILK